jgi:hypothetical protein
MRRKNVSFECAQLMRVASDVCSDPKIRQLRRLTHTPIHMKSRLVCETNLAKKSFIFNNFVQL